MSDNATWGHTTPEPDDNLSRLLVQNLERPWYASLVEQVRERLSNKKEIGRAHV